MMELVNLTPHVITICNGLGEIVESIAPSGLVARVDVAQVELEPINGIPVVTSTYGEVEVLQIENGETVAVLPFPEPREDVALIVGALVGARVALGRDDIYGPNTSKAIRNNGQVVGVPGFVRF